MRLQEPTNLLMSQFWHRARTHACTFISGSNPVR